MTNQERLQANNAKIEAIQETLKNKVATSGEIELTENNTTYDVSKYASAKTNVADMLQQRVNQGDCAHLFHSYKGTSLDFIKNLDTSKATDMSYMFQYCTKVQSLDVSGFDTSNVATMERMFERCDELTELDLSKFNTGKTTVMSFMFYDCSNLTSLNVSNFDTIHVSQMYGMFRNCSKLTNLDVSSFDTRNVTTMESMFNNCKELTSLDLKSFDTSKVNYMGTMFASCSKLVSIEGEINAIKCGSFSSMFSSCSALENVTLKNVKASLQLGSGTTYGHLLTDNSIINTFQELHDMTGSSAKTLTLSTPSNARTEAIYVKLIDVTDEMRAEDQYIDNKKPCVVCESTDIGAMTLKEYGISKNWQIK